MIVNLSYNMKPTYPYQVNFLQIAFLFVMFFCFCGCNSDNNELEKAREISEKYKSLEIKFNQLASKFEGAGNTIKQQQAENLTNNLGAYGNEIEEYINKKDISERRLQDWDEDLSTFSLDYDEIAGSDDKEPTTEPDPDGDGVLGKDDKCPNQFGERKDGCPKKDTDGDGVFDEDDDCPKKKGLKSNKGCPKGPPPPPPPPPEDSDFDGIYNIYDDCPYEFGIERCKGCNDSDGDGVCDQVDECSDEFGLERCKGCNDSDGDDVCDKVDQCPDKSGVAPDGCPKISCSSENKLIHIEKSQLCSEVLKSCTLTIQPKKRMIFEEFQVPASIGGGSLDYILKDNYGKTLFSRKDASTSSGISQFLIDRPLQADKTYKLILNPKADLSIKTYCVDNFRNDSIQLNYTSKPFIKQITFCQ